MTRSFATCALALLPLAVVPHAAPAQRRTYDQWNSWYTVNGDVGLSDRWSLLFDGSIRRSGPVDEAQALFVRGGLAYEVTDHVAVAAGANWSRSYPYGEVPISYATDERRVWQQVLMTHAVGRLAFSHRYRFEERFRGRRNDPDVDHVDRWERTSRFRYQVRGTLPFRGEAIDPGESYLTFANEIFLAFGRYVQYNVFDQDRAAVALGYRVNGTWRTEVGFLEQIAFKSNGLDVERNHTLTVTLGYSRPHAR